MDISPVASERGIYRPVARCANGWSLRLRDDMQFCVITYGCQMNFADSRVLAEQLRAAGHQQTQKTQDAELILVNTCCIRSTAENRAYGRLKSLKSAKSVGRLRFLGVCGCLAQKDAERMLEQVPHLDLIVGTRGLGRLFGHVEALEGGASPIVDVAEGPPFEPSECGFEPGDHQENVLEIDAYPIFVPITRGCNNRCAYCVVPTVRGPLESLSTERILNRIQHLVAHGCSEVTLIGQNANVYRYGDIDFADLLRTVHEVRELSRIRFVTSHPKDLTDRIIDAVAELPKVCEYFHLPMQSGSDRILKLMHRGYSASEYKELVAKIRERVKTPKDSGNVSLCTDLIVGFPGESDSDFEETLKCVNEIQWDGAYTFMYSSRDIVPAEQLPGKVPRKVKSERLNRLVAAQTEISHRINACREGQLEEVFVESTPARRAEAVRPSMRQEQWYWKARTRNNKLVYVKPVPERSDFAVGTVLTVRIKEARAYTLFGEMPTCHTD